MFVVEIDSSISGLNILRSPDTLLSNAVVNHFNLMPPWSPGKSGKNDVPCTYYLPIKFVAAEKSVRVGR